MHKNSFESLSSDLIQESVEVINDKCIFKQENLRF